MNSSRYLQIVENNSDYGLCYHSLLGSLFLLEPDYLRAVKKYRNQSVPEGDIINDSVLSELRSANYLEKNASEAREILASRNAEWMNKVPGGGRLSMLDLIVSEVCNFGCQHCLHKCSVSQNKNHGNKKLMDFETAREVIDKYIRLVRQWDSHAQLSIHFGSAEPLLNWNVVKRASEYIRSIDPHAIISINTNISLMTPKIAKFIKQYDIQISTSLDGPKEGNDAIRTFQSGGGTYKAIMRAFEIMNDAGLPIDGFSVTINDLNFDHVTPEFIDWAAEKGFKSIASDIDLINVANASRTIDECIDKLIVLRLACLKHDMESFGSWTTAYDYLVNGNEDNISTFCRAVRGKNISVNPEGIAFICGHTTTVIGDLSNFEEIFQRSSRYCQLVESRMPGKDAFCLDCSLEGICAGQCHITREVAVSTGNGRMNYLCDFNRRVTNRLLELKLQSELGKMVAKEVIQCTK